MINNDVEISQRLADDIGQLIDEQPTMSILAALITVLESLHENCFNNSIEDLAEHIKDLLIRLHYHRINEEKEGTTIQ